MLREVVMIIVGLFASGIICLKKHVGKGSSAQDNDLEEEISLIADLIYR